MTLLILSKKLFYKAILLFDLIYKEIDHTPSNTFKIFIRF